MEMALSRKKSVTLKPFFGLLLFSFSSSPHFSTQLNLFPVFPTFYSAIPYSIAIQLDACCQRQLAATFASQIKCSICANIAYTPRLPAGFPHKKKNRRKTSGNGVQNPRLGGGELPHTHPIREPKLVRNFS